MCLCDPMDRGRNSASAGASMYASLMILKSSTIFICNEESPFRRSLEEPRFMVLTTCFGNIATGARWFGLYQKTNQAQLRALEGGFAKSLVVLGSPNR